MSSVSLVSTSTEARGLRSPFNPDERIRAVLFDLDGTLYRQSLMRAAMALELLAAGVWQPWQAARRWRALRTFREAQELLRSLPLIGSDDPQLARAAARSNMRRADVARLVDEWMFERPLKYMPLCRARGLTDLLDGLERRRLALGVLSDYPPVGKLEALGVADRFQLVLCSTDPEIRAFKPNPRGFLIAARRWGLSPREVLMVGDRVDVDAAGAAAAGMPCVIVGRPKRLPRSQTDLLFVPSFERLRRVLHAGC
jgi:putative hydrolase of the HAD superfamily